MSNIPLTKMSKCPNCMGDGKETCHNPDHGFYSMAGCIMSGNESSCPGCGHSQDHKIRKYKDGKYVYGICETCNGSGQVPEYDVYQYIDEFVTDEDEKDYIIEKCLSDNI